MSTVEAAIMIPAIGIGALMALFGLVIALNLGGISERRTRRNFAQLRALLPNVGTPPEAVVLREVRLMRIAGIGFVAGGLFLSVVFPLGVHQITGDNLF